MQPSVKSSHINCTVELQIELNAFVSIEEAGIVGFWRKRSLSKIVRRFVN